MIPKNDENAFKPPDAGNVSVDTLPMCMCHEHTRQSQQFDLELSHSGGAGKLPREQTAFVTVHTEHVFTHYVAVPMRAPPRFLRRAPPAVHLDVVNVFAAFAASQILYTWSCNWRRRSK